jgi:hypothetical protein
VQSIPLQLLLVLHMRKLSPDFVIPL